MNRKKDGKVAELSDRLRAAMAEKDIRPVDLVERTGIPKSMISYYLSGKNLPKADRLYLMAQTLGVNEAWLMGYDVPKARTPEQQKNDQLALVIKQLRADPDFLDVVLSLAELPAEQYASVKTILAGLNSQK